MTKCYFAHPYGKRGGLGERRIIKTLEKRGIEPINPFDGEDKFLAERGIEGGKYYKKPLFDVACEMWEMDMKSVADTDILLAWIPKLSLGTPQELAIAAMLLGHGIIIISSIRHPSIAFYKQNYGARLYDSIDDFENNIESSWGNEPVA